MKKELKKSTIIILLIAIILIQIVARIYAGNKKEYFHMDEAYSYGLMNYDKITITDNQDFYNTWHTNKYYEDYLTVNEEEVLNLKPVYENQKNDVHPPLYYLLLRISATFSIDTFTKWTGIILNILICIISTIFVYLISKKLLKNPIYALIITFIAGLTVAALETTIYIRMYELTNMFILITTYIFIKNYDKDSIGIKNYILIILTLILGSLTHYYYVIYVFTIYVIYIAKYIKKKQIKQIGIFTLNMAIAAAISLLIFPYSISHVFFGYRGAGSANLNLNEILQSILRYISILDNKILNYMGVIVLIIAIYLLITKKDKIKIDKEFKILTIPTLIYFIIVSILTPYKELRYMMPICSVLIITIMYTIIKLLQAKYSFKTTAIIASIIFTIIILMPVFTGLKLDFAYNNLNNVAKKIEDINNKPAVYVFNPNNNRYLDDIYLFTIIQDSYILKYEGEPVQFNEILDGKDTQNGIIAFFNENVEEEQRITEIKEQLNLENVELIQHLNAAKVYYIY